MTSYNQGPLPKKKSGPSVFLILSIVGGVALVGFVGLVGGVVFLLSKARMDSTTLEQVQSKDGLCSIVIPDNWPTISARDRNPDASLQFGHLLGERYVLVISDTKKDAVDVLGLGNAGGQEALEGFTEYMMNAMSESLSMKRISNRVVNINGLPGIQHKFNAKVEGLDIIFWITYVEGKDHFYQVQVWTLTSMEEENEDRLLEVANSFKEN